MLGKIFSSLRMCVLAAFVGLTFVHGNIQALTLIEDFSDSPFGRFTIAGPGVDQFVYQVDASAFTGDPEGSLLVDYNSSRPTTRFSAPLGITVTDGDTFSFGAIMTIQSEGYAPDPNGYAQLAFGLTNSVTSGSDRTGDWESYAGDTFDMVEFDYFPNVSPWFYGPYVALSVFGSPLTNDAFGNFAFTTGAFGGSYPLPLDTPLFIQIDYDGETTTASLKVSDIANDGSLTELATGVSPLMVSGLIGGFSVDTISISVYKDGYSFPGFPSLVATVTYDKLFFTSGAPEIIASVDIDPDTLNLKSKGNPVTAYLTLPSGYNVEDIDIESVRLMDAIDAVWGEIQGGTLMLKFSRAEVQGILSEGENTVTISGELTDGAVFTAVDTIRVK